MSTMTQKSMMWRTTFVFGAVGLAMTLAYVGFLLTTSTEHGTAFRVLAGVTLTVGAFACLEKAIRELRGKTAAR
jgi:hypothetical protein